MNITLVSSSLTKGGAERVVASLAQGLSAAQHSVSIVVKHERSDQEYDPGERVQVIRLPERSARRLHLWKRFGNAFSRRLDLRRAILDTNPDVVVAFTTIMNVRVLLALRGVNVPVVVSERNNPNMVKVKLKWRVLRRLTYSNASLLVSLSRGVDGCFDWMPAPKRAVIYNPLPLDISTTLGEERALVLSPSSRYFVACGRLEHQKGFDLLIEAFASIARDLPQWELVILGEGSQRNSLSGQAIAHQIQDRLHLPGRVANPVAYFASCDVFVLSSRFEGFGNVILEAMYAGLPVVGFDCEYGPSEIIESGVNGFLVESGSITALAAAMSDLAKDEAMRLRIASQARERVSDFANATIIAQWISTLESIATCTKE